MKIIQLTFAALALAASAFALPSSSVFAYSHNTPNLPTLELTYADASVASVTASLAGWYQSNGTPNGGGNWIAGLCGSSDACAGGDILYRNVFVFLLPSPGVAVVSASLRSFMEGLPLPGYINAAPSSTYTMYDVAETPESILMQTPGVAIYDDLGTGPVYGSRVFTAADNGTFVDVVLNGTAIASINASAGLNWAVGGDNVSGSPIPEPGTWAMMGAGLAAAVAARLRK